MKRIFQASNPVFSERLRILRGCACCVHAEVRNPVPKFQMSSELKQLKRANSADALSGSRGAWSDFKLQPLVTHRSNWGMEMQVCTSQVLFSARCNSKQRQMNYMCLDFSSAAFGSHSSHSYLAVI